MKSLARSTSLHSLCCVLCVIPSAAQFETPREQWYTRYKAYPPYCSTPQEMETRKIPLLSTDQQTQLIHVTAIIRHGARTPYSGQLNCWEDYEPVWNCNLTTYIATPPAQAIAQWEQEKGSTDTGILLFEKHYDALTNVDHNLSNDLLGSCQTGQLLLTGYEQELTNGRFLRVAYFQTDDSSSQLINASTTPWTDVYYRADDDQRTLMSGQVLLRGLFGPEIDRFGQNNTLPTLPLHTADRLRDIVDPNPVVCPRLGEIQHAFEQSPEFQAFQTSHEKIILEKFKRQVLKVDNMEAIDCLMTTICTDRELPAAVNDYGGDSNRQRRQSSYDEYGDNRFQRLYDLEVKSVSMLYKYNNAEYSKLGMGPLWAEITDNLHAILDNKSYKKLALFSGHDTTLMPLLATIDVFDGTWPPYASMVILEVHRLNLQDETFSSGHAFRLLYNGKVITDRLIECDTELCDLAVLTNRVASFATRQWNCTLQHNAASRVELAPEEPIGIWAVGLLAVGSALLGSLCTYLYVAGQRRQRRSRVAQSDVDENSSDISMRDDEPSHDLQLT